MKLVNLMPLKEELEQTPLEVIAHDDNQIYYIDPRDIETYIHGQMVVAMEKLGSPSKELTRDNSDATPGQIDNDDPVMERFQKLAGIKSLNEQDDSNNTTKVKLKMSNIEDEVTIVEKPGKVLEDVTISWGNESHTVTFEEEGQIDDHGNEGMDLEFMAESDDGKWQFILDVYAEASYPNTDPTEWDWEELIIQDHPDDESHLDPEDRSDYDGPLEEEDIDEGTCGYSIDGEGGDEPAGSHLLNKSNLQERLQIRAGIIK